MVFASIALNQAVSQESSDFHEISTLIEDFISRMSTPLEPINKSYTLDEFHNSCLSDRLLIDSSTHDVYGFTEEAFGKIPSVIDRLLSAKVYCNTLPISTVPEATIDHLVDIAVVAAVQSGFIPESVAPFLTPVIRQLKNSLHKSFEQSLLRMRVGYMIDPVLSDDEIQYNEIEVNEIFAEDVKSAIDLPPMEIRF